MAARDPFDFDEIAGTKVLDPSGVKGHHRPTVFPCLRFVLFRECRFSKLVQSSPCKAPRGLISSTSDLLNAELALAQENLGSLEFQLLSVLLEHPRHAYGVTIMQRVEERTGRTRSLAAIYAALDRLQEKGLVSSWWGEPTAERGGRRKRYYKIEASGAEAVRRMVQPFGGMIPAGAGA
jgi:PadR family transcriptional regulator, regulatory protein PadR